ncbi:MAG TPA: hypothetical protein VMT15_11630 [Bryobacteraceae bacterium]|nr:hypothetical protein [Bryobacteraceae bacterium]
MHRRRDYLAAAVIGIALESFWMLMKAVEGPRDTVSAWDLSQVPGFILAGMIFSPLRMDPPRAFLWPTVFLAQCAVVAAAFLFFLSIIRVVRDLFRGRD